MVVIWFFVVFILTQSYTASLTSLLTVQQLQPTITDVNQLLKNQPWVGYQDGSFVLGLLASVGIKNLRPYDTPEQLDELFKLGSSNGGIDAAFDEIPYVKLFLSKFPDKYIMADPNYKTDGFGFVSIKAPLLPLLLNPILSFFLFFFFLNKFNGDFVIGISDGVAIGGRRVESRVKRDGK